MIKHQVLVTVLRCPLLEKPGKTTYLEDVQAPLLLDMQTERVSNIEEVRKLK